MRQPRIIDYLTISLRCLPFFFWFFFIDVTFSFCVVLLEGILCWRCRENGSTKTCKVSVYQSRNMQRSSLHPSVDCISVICFSIVKVISLSHGDWFHGCKTKENMDASHIRGQSQHYKDLNN